MSYTYKTAISATAAGEMITKALGISGPYFLVDNRRERHNYVIPYFTEKGKIMYFIEDIENFIMRSGRGKRISNKLLKKIGISSGVWLVGPGLSDDGIPLVLISRGTSESLTADDARELANCLRDIADEADRLK